MRATAVIDVAPAQAAARQPFSPGTVRHLLVVCSTPFDATFALGGVIGAFTAAGTAVRIVCLTHGRRPDLGTRRRLDRAAELLEAAHLLGAEEACLLGHRAGHLQGNSPETLASELRAVAGVVDAVLTVDAHAPDAHPDHVQTMLAAQHVAQELHCPLYAWTRSPGSTGASSAGHRPGRVVTVDSDRDRQRAAIACHGMSPDDPVRDLAALDQPHDHLLVLRA